MVHHRHHWFVPHFSEKYIKWTGQSRHSNVGTCSGTGGAHSEQREGATSAAGGPWPPTPPSKSAVSNNYIISDTMAFNAQLLFATIYDTNFMPVAQLHSPTVNLEPHPLTILVPWLHVELCNLLHITESSNTLAFLQSANISRQDRIRPHTQLFIADIFSCGYEYPTCTKISMSILATQGWEIHSHKTTAILQCMLWLIQQAFTKFKWATVMWNNLSTFQPITICKAHITSFTSLCAVGTRRWKHVQKIDTSRWEQKHSRVDANRIVADRHRIWLLHVWVDEMAVAKSSCDPNLKTVKSTTL